MHRRQLLSSVAGFMAMAASIAARATAGPKPVPVIFHTDIGYDVDDTWALLLLLRRPELDLKLVVTEGKNALYRARVVAKCLTLAGHKDIPVVYGPDADNMSAPQSEWLADFDIRSYPMTRKGDRAKAMVDLIMASADKVSLICVGPATSTAEALRLEPKIASKARFIGMHGSVRIGYDAKPTPDVEYNVKTDPLALRAVLAASWECAITPLDTCGLLTFDGPLYQTLRHSRDPFAQAIRRNSEVWLPNAPWMPKGFDISRQSSTQFDSVAVMMAAGTPDLIYETLPICVADDGMTVIDPIKGRAVRVATKWKDMARFKQALVDDLTRYPATS